MTDDIKNDVKKNEEVVEAPPEGVPSLADGLNDSALTDQSDEEISDMNPSDEFPPVPESDETDIVDTENGESASVEFEESEDGTLENLPQVDANFLQLDPESDDPDELWVIPQNELLQIIEGLIFVSGRTVTLQTLHKSVKAATKKQVRLILSDLMEKYNQPEFGFHLTEVGNGYRFRSDPVCAPYIQEMMKARPLRLSRAALETLAIVAYRQPVTRAEIEDIRGVDAGGVLKLLLDKHLLRVLGKREEPGRPLIYGTSKEFLEVFHLKSLKDLPTLQEFHELNEEQQTKLDSTYPQEQSEADEQIESQKEDLFKETFHHADDSNIAKELDLAADSLDEAVDEADQAINDVLGRTPYDELDENDDVDLDAAIDVEVVHAPKVKTETTTKNKSNSLDMADGPDSDPPLGETSSPAESDEEKKETGE